MKCHSIILWTILLGVTLFGACIDDKGNYDYLSENDVMPAEISNLEDEYSVIFGSSRRFEAKVDHVEGVENLRYMWYMYKQNSGKRDTLGYGKVLDMEILFESGTYELWFEVRDTVSDVCVDKKMQLTIENVLSTAWLVAKTVNGETDIDVVRDDGDMLEDLLYNMAGERMKGNAVSISYSNGHYHEMENKDGTVTTEKRTAFFVVSDENIHTYNAETMQLYKSTEDCFYELPAVIKPGFLQIDGSDVCMINNGKIYGYANNSANVGKFGLPMVGVDGSYNYELSPETVFFFNLTGLVWDKQSRSMLYLHLYNAQLEDFQNSNEGGISVKNMDVDMLHLLFRSKIYDSSIYNYVANLYGIMKNEAGDAFLAEMSLAPSKKNYPLRGYYRLPAGCAVVDAKVLAAHQTTAKIFYANNDELWVHEVRHEETDVQKLEKKLLSFNCEEIVYMKHVSVARTDIDCLVVLTNSANGWKLYTFPFLEGGGEFDTSVDLEKACIAKGKGEANYLLRMHNGYAY